MSTVQKAVFAAALLLAVGASIHEARRALRLADQVQTLQRRQAALAEQVQQLTRERDLAVSELAALRDLNERANRTSADVRRRQGDSQGRAKVSTDPTDAAATSWLAAVKQLKQRLEETPGAKIPELQFLDAFDWVELAHSANLETDADYRKALGEVRKRAEGYFTKSFQSALNQYMDTNSGQWPPDLGQLKPFFDPAVDDAILDRWQIVSKDAFPGREFAGDWVLTEKSPVDAEFDHRWTIDGPGSGGVGPYQYIPSETDTLKRTLQSALDAYAAENNGREPSNPNQIQPYITTPTQQAALQRIIEIRSTKGVR